MQIELPPDLAQRVKDRAAIASGVSNVDVIRQGLEALDWLDVERQAIQAGIDAVNNGHVQDFRDFDREFRQRNGIAPSA